jgi:hypothetical protein
MMYHDDDELDRALFALHLEEPPAGLRASILTATVYRPAPPFTLLEAGIAGAAVAVVIWLAVMLATGAASPIAQTISTGATTLARSLSNISTLAWLAAGGATALWISLFTGSQPRELASRRV